MRRPTPTRRRSAPRRSLCPKIAAGVVGRTPKKVIVVNNRFMNVNV